MMAAAPAPNAPATRASGSIARVYALKQEAQAQLHVPAIVALARRPPEVRVGRVRVRPVQVGVVDEVEHLGAELHLARAAQAEVLEEGDVPLLLARVVDQVARRVAERACRRAGEGGGVEPEILVVAIAGRERLVGTLRHIADEVHRLAVAALADAGD